MPIVGVVSRRDPDDLEPGEYLLVDSDARTTARATLEIELWCREHHLSRLMGSTVDTVVQPDGTRVRRARCFQPYPQEVEQAERSRQELERRVDRMPVTVSAVELLRE